jgi:hypothetical protein
VVQFARWVAARDYRAALVAAGLTFLPLLAVFSCTALALAGLQRGAGAGWRSAGIATAALAVVAALVGGSPAAAVIPAAALWAPSVAMTQVLMTTGSLSIAARLAGTAALVLAAGWVLLAPAPGEPWREAITTMAEQFAAGSGLETAELAERVLTILPGIMAASILLASLLGVFLAMWFHAALTRPGAFGEAFRALQVGPLLGGLAALTFATATTGVPVALAAAVPLGTLMVIQGLAVVHGLARIRGWHRTWLVAAWLALLLAWPWATFAFGLYGMLDTFLNFRGRSVQNG